MDGLAQSLLNSALQPDQYEGRMIDLTNQDRMANGLPQLTWDDQTLAIARQRAQQQLGDQPLNHYDLYGNLIFQQMLNHAALPYGNAGENLARWDGVDLSQVEQALMASPTHRANILEPSYTHMAIGMAYPDQQQQPNSGDLAELFRN